MIKVEEIAKSFGKLTVFDDFSLEFPEGEITAILGPSGCGKSTLLNIIAGLENIDRGNLITSSNISYLFQEPRLLPWLTISQNVALVLQNKMSDQEIKELVFENLKATGLTDYANYYPAQLSGGMRQRAAMARAFSYDAPLLLMDEPFKSLDLKTRFQLIQDFWVLWQQKPRTVVMVTHDVKEAVLLASLIIILSEKPAKIIKLYRHEPFPPEQVQNATSLALEKEIWQLLLHSNAGGP